MELLGVYKVTLESKRWNALNNREAFCVSLRCRQQASQLTWSYGENFCGRVQTRFRHSVCDVWSKTCEVLDCGWRAADWQAGVNKYIPTDGG